VRQPDSWPLTAAVPDSSHPDGTRTNANRGDQRLVTGSGWSAWHVPTIMLMLQVR